MTRPRTETSRGTCRLALARWLALLTAILLFPAPAVADWPAWIERLLFNPTERTARALESFENGDAEDAVEPLETALRLEENHPVAQYNAGTGRLNAGAGDALSLLESAAEGGPSELVARARYNLGNARMAGDDLPGAIEAFKQALRADPGMADAKFNLELAQRQLQEQQQQQEQQQDGEQNDEEQQDSEQQDGEQQDGEQQDGEQDPDQQEQQQQDREQQQDQEQQQDPDQQQQQEQESPLPQFRDLPDMTAEEAAAILEAVENLEREQRRREALEAAKKNARGKKDW